MSIKILSDEIINQIAAGEVVERPASVVKELVENAIDAGATDVTVSVEDGGKDRISVRDNGSGITKEELELAVTRHATSKINSMQDLERLVSLGFRGEALASVASVSDLVIRSRLKGEAYGYELRVLFGKKEPIQKIGMPEGTEVEVRNLFKQLPAREKFLKTAATEQKHISLLMTSFALAHPHVRFILKSSNRELLHAPVVDGANLSTEQKRIIRIESIWDRDFSTQLLTIFFDHPHLKIAGYIGNIALSSRSLDQWLFVNNRWVEDKALHFAVREGYGGLLPPKARPFFIIFIETPTHMVDVNVHPRKQEVRFASPQFVFQSVKKAVQAALGKQDLTPEVGGGMQNAEVRMQKEGKKYDLGFTNYEKRRQEPLLVRDSYRREPLPWDSSLESSFTYNDQTATGTNPQYQVFDNVYIFSFEPSAVEIYDQHALHERILFEQFKQNFEQGVQEGDQQVLLIPQKVKLSGGEWEVFEENREMIGNLGFTIKEVGDRELEVQAVPSVLKGTSIQNLLPSVLEDWAELENITADQELALAYMACRSAVKAGDKLSNDEVASLLQQASQYPDHYTCPHGRPFKIRLTRGELDKWFKRTGFG